MKTTAFALSILLSASLSTAQTSTGGKVPEVLNFTMKSLTGQPVSLSKYQGRVVLIVNTASECGFTYQYEGLQALHYKYVAQGLSILGSPSIDFETQTPSADADG